MRYALFIMALFCAAPANASRVNIGQPLPAVYLGHGGELVVTPAGLNYLPWSAQQLTGQVGLVIHVAGRLSAKSQLGDLTDRLKQANLLGNGVRITTLVNTDDVLPGSAVFVRQSIAGSKQASPGQIFVIDSSGVVAHRWQLQPQSAAVIITDKQGRVRFFHEGSFGSRVARQIIQQLHQLAVQ